MCGLSCESRSLKAGIYKVTITQDTGPLVGLVKGELDVTIQDPNTQPDTRTAQNRRPGE